jgi:outer membrane protein assembly factor BamB
LGAADLKPRSKQKNMASNIIYVGLKAHVVAVEKTTGAILWKTKLKGGLTSGTSFVTLLVEDGKIYAHTCGELVGLDAETGAVLWRNELSGLGYDIASLATDGKSSPPLSVLAAQQQAQSRNTAAATGTLSATS